MIWSLLTAIVINLAAVMPIVTVDFSRMLETMNEHFYPLMADQHRYLNLIGGGGSGKSVLAAQKCVHRVVSEPGHRIVVVRKVAKTIRESCWAETKTAIDRWGLNPIFNINKSDFTITCPAAKGSLIFVGLDDPEKLKSIHDPTSFWIEEATELMPEDLTQIGLRLRGSNGTYNQVILTYNPISERHWLKRRFVDTDQHGLTRIHKSTYLHNRFLPPAYVMELDDLRARDPEAYDVYGKGLWGKRLSGLVYGQDIIIPLELYPTQPDETIYGLDFGYNNPTALVQLDYYDRSVYTRERLYLTGLTTDDLIARMDAMLISKSDVIYGDTAEPDRIETISRAGYNIKPADKRQGSVGAGIAVVKATELCSHPGNENFNAEWNGYAWKRDRLGNILDEPEKINDHAMDALRMALFTHAQSRVPEPDFFTFKMEKRHEVRD